MIVEEFPLGFPMSAFRRRNPGSALLEEGSGVNSGPAVELLHGEGLLDDVVRVEDHAGRRAQKDAENVPVFLAQSPETPGQVPHVQERHVAQQGQTDWPGRKALIMSN